MSSVYGLQLNYTVSRNTSISVHELLIKRIGMYVVLAVGLQPLDIGCRLVPLNGSICDKQAAGSCWS